MSAPIQAAPGVPLQGLVMFEVYEASGSLLLVTSDGSAARDAATASGDFLVRRPWATAATPEAFK